MELGIRPNSVNILEFPGRREVEPTNPPPRYATVCVCVCARARSRTCLCAAFSEMFERLKEWT
jgi:hypothetical protein